VGEKLYNTVSTLEACARVAANRLILAKAATVSMMKVAAE
jgi:hypothetical protein